MCIGWPMQVEALSPGHAQVRRATQRRTVRTALVEQAGPPLQPGDWLLVFLDDARERLTPERAAEVEATLALVEAALGGQGVDPAGDPGFVLPSSLPPTFFEKLT